MRSWQCCNKNHIHLDHKYENINESADNQSFERFKIPSDHPLETTWREIIDGIVPIQAQLIRYYKSLGYHNLAGCGLIEDVRALLLLALKMTSEIQLHFLTY
jgi:hypothetical protein